MEGMKRFAFHKLYALTFEATMQIVVADDAGFYHTHYALEGEMPGVVWLGGIGLLLPQGIVPRAGDSVAVLLRKAEEMPGTDRWMVWKACGVPTDADIRSRVGLWRPVF